MVNWDSGASARFYGCNTAQNFTSDFSAAQGVTTYGFLGDAYFSSDPTRRDNPGPKGPVYMIQATGFNSDGLTGVLTHLFGNAFAVPLARSDP
jgi:hypothetical protein